MNLNSIVLSSMLRQKTKKAFLLIAMVIGCASIVALFTFVHSQKMKIEYQFDEYGANIVIMPKSDSLSLTYGGINVSGVVDNVKHISLTDTKKIWTIKNKLNIRVVAPKLLGASKVQKGDVVSSALLVGVEYDSEFKIKTWWQLDGKKPTKKNEVLVGSEAARKLNLVVGDSVLIGNKKAVVSAIIKSTGSQDDQVVIGDIGFVSSILGKADKVSLIEVSALCADCPIDELVSQISEKLPNADVKGIKQIMTQKMQMVKQFEQFAISVVGVIILIGGILVFTSMMGSVNDRKNEIGIFRAIGFGRRDIFRIIILESVVLSVMAAFIGISCGLIISYVLLPRVTDISAEMIVIDSSLVLGNIVGVTLLGAVAALYPALAASNVDPVKVLNP